jgi:hypothetical protein
MAHAAEQLPQRRVITGRHANDQPVVVVHAFLLRWEGDRFTKSTIAPPDDRDAIDVAGEITEDLGGAAVSAGASAEVSGASIVHELVVGTSTRRTPSSLRFAGRFTTPAEWPRPW